ncbi:MAG: hypothetical protein U5S82_00945 [Gammaproteobacteria bacterium]|nr:hypothetical protein [Gammaproteobacteria bacterium]
MNRKFSLPCCFCNKRKNCITSFLCSKAFGLRIGLSLVAAVALVIMMQQIFPHLFSSTSPDSYSVTGHPMDRLAEEKRRASDAADHATPPAADKATGSVNPDHDS